MKTAVASVIYNEAIEFLEEFLESLKKQTSQDFTLIIVNDNISAERLSEIELKMSAEFPERFLVVDRYSKKLTPAELRVEMIKSAFELQYDLLIMMDCDDKASKNRVECFCKQYDSTYGFFYNELRDFEGQEVMPTLPSYTLDYKEISEYNYLGMSNCGINLNQLTPEFVESLKDGATPVFDWYLYSRLLLNGEKGKKIEGCFTYYRIYEANLAGKCNYTKEAVDKEILVKRKQYLLLSKYGKYFRNLANVYERSLFCENDSCENGYWWSLTRSNYIEGEGMKK